MDERPKLNFTAEEFHRVKEKAEAAYKALPQVYCPYLTTSVKFNAKGLEHLKFKARRHERSHYDQFMRFKLLHHAPEALRKSHTLQGINETSTFERQKRHGHWEGALKRVIYYEFIAVMDRVRTKVIVKRVEGEECHFYSIIPFWRVSVITKKRLLYDGNSELD
jgi:hypothetical protein